MQLSIVVVDGRTTPLVGLFLIARVSRIKAAPSLHQEIC
jgi:hypothetical protein